MHACTNKWKLKFTFFFYIDSEFFSLRMHVKLLQRFLFKFINAMNGCLFASWLICLRLKKKFECVLNCWLNSHLFNFGSTDMKSINFHKYYLFYYPIIINL